MSVLAAISIVETGSWSTTVDAQDLLSGAGSDLADTQTSTSNQVTLDISGTTGDTDNWSVNIRRTDTTWDSDFTVYVRRTGGGTGGGTISGGTTFQAVTTTDAQLFTGAGDRSGIQLEFKVTGFSVSAIPVDSYATSLTYSIVDEP